MAHLKVTCHNCGAVSYHNSTRCMVCNATNTTAVSDEDDLGAFLDPLPCPLGEARARLADDEATGRWSHPWR